MLLRFLRPPVLWAIRLYQRTLSPDHGPLKAAFPQGFCRFYPSCSQYVYDSVDRYGICWGLIKGSWRILRCNPWNQGGYDPVVKEK